MPKLELNSAIKNIRGSMDNWTYRRSAYGPLVARRPSFAAREPSPAELQARDNFRQASAFADAVLADPVQRERYRALGAQRKLPARAIAVADYFRPPVVGAIDTSGYHGTIGDSIVVRATDDVGVAAVTVVIRGAADAVIEQGPAVLNEGQWHYVATSVVASGENVTVEATAVDAPGHTGTKSVPLVVA